jgi:hypothetical protein
MPERMYFLMSLVTCIWLFGGCACADAPSEAETDTSHRESGNPSSDTTNDGDADGDHQLEIIVSLKDGETGVRQVQVFTVPGSSDNCLLWPTGRGNYLRNGYVPAE